MNVCIDKESYDQGGGIKHGYRALKGGAALMVNGVAICLYDLRLVLHLIHSLGLLRLLGKTNIWQYRKSRGGHWLSNNHQTKHRKQNH